MKTINSLLFPSLQHSIHAIIALLVVKLNQTLLIRHESLGHVIDIIFSDWKTHV